VSGFPGKPVDWLTVASQSTGEVPPRQDFWLCRDPECDLVYFGAGGAVLNRGDLRQPPGFKTESDGLLCYCFQYRRGDIERQLADTGGTTVVEEIKARVRARRCACEVRNPSGKCCLGEVQRAVDELRASMNEVKR
jgi:hypothetical protein